MKIQFSSAREKKWTISSQDFLEIENRVNALHDQVSLKQIVHLSAESGHVDGGGREGRQGGQVCV